MLLSAWLTNSDLQYSWVKILHWTIQAILIIFPITGFILGHQYEKSTRKISTGKVLSIVSGIVVAILTTLSLIGYIQTENKAQEYKERHNYIRAV